MPRKPRPPRFCQLVVATDFHGHPLPYRMREDGLVEVWIEALRKWLPLERNDSAD